MLRLESDLSAAELQSMRDAYGALTTTSAIGRNPPLPGAVAGVEFSKAVRRAAAAVGPGEVTASALADRIRRLHPEYGDASLGSVTLDVHAGDQRPVDEWLTRVRGCYDALDVADSRHKVIDGRLALAALAALDEPLAEAIGQPALAALQQECEVRPAPPEPPVREHVRWLADEPVGLDGDELGRRGVASALLHQLEALVETYPGRSFLVHIDGAWGAGKSTLLRFLQESVGEATARAASRRTGWLSPTTRGGSRGRGRRGSLSCRRCAPACGRPSATGGSADGSGYARGRG
jgi:hypothetical protein